MSRKREYLSGCAAAISDVALLGTIMHFIIVDTRIESVYVPIGWWILILLAVYTVDFLLLQREMSANLYMALNGIFALMCGMMGWKLAFTEPMRTTVQIVFTLIFFGTSIHCALNAMSAMKQRTMVLYVDLIMGVFTFFLYCESYTKSTQAVDIKILCIAVLVLDLVVLILMRTENGGVTIISGRSFFGVGFLLVLLGGFVGIAVAVVMFASGQVKSLVELMLMVLRWMVSVLEAIGDVVNRFLIWLISLLPDPEPYQTDTPEIVEETVETVEEVGEISWFLVFLFILVFVALLTWAIWHARGYKIKIRRKRAGTIRYVRRESKASAHLKGLLRRWKQAILFHYKSIRYRKTPMGILAWVERQEYRKKNFCKISESGGAYLRRIAERLSIAESTATEETSRADAIEALQQLANMVDRSCYRKEQFRLTDEEYQSLKRKLHF